MSKVRMITLSKGVFYLLLIGVLSYLLRLYFSACVAQYLNAHIYGDFSITYRLILLISLVFLMGTNISSVKYLSKYHDKKDFNSYNHFINWNIKFVLKVFIICSSVFLVFYIVILVLHLTSVKDISTYHLSIYSFWLAPFCAIFLLLSSIILSLKLSNFSLFLNQMSTYLCLSFFILITIYFLDVTVHFYYLMMILLISFCAIIFLELVAINMKVKKQKIKLNIKPKKYSLINHSDKRKWLTDSINLNSVQLIFNIICIVDLVVVEFIHPNEHAVGYYAAILEIGNIIWVIPRSTTFFLLSKVAPLLENKDYAKLQKLVNLINIINLPILITTLFLMVYLSRSILSFFGPNYIHVEGQLIVLGIAYFIGAVSMINAKILLFLNSKRILITNIVELIVLTVLSIVLINFFGIYGVVSAVMAATIVKSLLLFFFVKKSIPIKPYSVV